MPATVSLIVDAAITRLDALEQIARAVGTGVSESGTSTAFVRLAGSASATIDIPKFGEAPPLAIDVTASDADAARAAADALLLQLGASTDWPIARDF